MAEENNRAEEAIEDAIEAIKLLSGHVARGGKITEDSLKKLAQSAQLTSNSFEKASDAISGLNAMKVAAYETAAELAKGKHSFGMLTSIISGVTAGLKGLAGLVPGAGKAIAATLGVLGDGLELAVKRTEDVWQTFARLSQAGSGFSEGFQGITERFVRAGLPMDQFSELVTKNSRALAALSGSVIGSTDEVSKAMNTLRGGMDRPLRNLGYTTEEIGETMIFYADMLRRGGLRQVMQQDQLTASTIAYGKELDEIARLTGLSRKEQQVAFEQAMSNARFNATMQELLAQGRTAEVAEIRRVNSVFAALDPTGEKSRAFQDTISGYITSGSAIKEFNTAGSAMLDLTKDLKSGAEGVAAFGRYQDRVNERMPMLTKYAQAIGDDAGTFTAFAGNANIANFALGDFAKTAEENRKDQKRLMSDASTETDEQRRVQKERHQNLVQASIDLETAAIQVDALIQSVVGTTTVIKGLASAIETVTTAVNSTFGVPTNTGGGGTVPTEVTVANSPLLEKMRDLDVERNRLLRERAGIPIDEFAHETGADLELQEINAKIKAIDNEIGLLNDKLKQEEIKAQKVQAENTVTVGKIIEDAIKRTGRSLDTATVKPFLTASELENIYAGEGAAVSTRKRAEIDALINREGLYTADGGINRELLASIRRIVQRLDPMEVQMPTTPSGTNIPPMETGQEGARGNIMTGPKSGYRATLHGTEAVIPLEGRAIPIEISDNRDFRPQIDLMEKQIARLDAMINEIQKNTSINEKILRTSYG